MGAAMRIVKFGVGSVIGFVLGAAASMLAAPRGGDETRKEIAERLKAAQVAGIEAQAAKEAELIGRFRAEVGDATALREEEHRVRIEREQAVRAIGLGLNAPGALAAQAAMPPIPPPEPAPSEEPSRPS